MLPAFAKIHTLPRTALAATLALGMALPAAPALAWDRHEQGILTGVVGLLAIQGLINASKAQAQQQQAYEVAPVPMPQKPANVVYVPRASRTPAAYAFSSYSGAERRAIQRSLARAGYYYGPIDGAFGPATYNAALDYAHATGAGAAIGSQAGAYGVYDDLLYSR